MKQRIKKIEKVAKKIKLSLREKKHLSNVPRGNGLYFLIGLVAVLTIVFALFQMKFEKKEVVVGKPIIEMSSDDYIVPPDFIEEKNIPIELLDEVNRIHIQELTYIKVVDNDEDVLPVVIYDSSVIVERAPRIADIDVELVEETVEPIPISLVSDMPIYPGCEIFSSKQKKLECMSQKINEHINKEFDAGLATEHGIKGRQKILVTFVINTKGEISNVKARAPHPELKKEVVRVVNSLPRMKPAKQGYRKVNVTYSLPVIFVVE